MVLTRSSPRGGAKSSNRRSAIDDDDPRHDDPHHVARRVWAQPADEDPYDDLSPPGSPNSHVSESMSEGSGENDRFESRSEGGVERFESRSEGGVEGSDDEIHSDDPLSGDDDVFNEPESTIDVRTFVLSDAGPKPVLPPPPSCIDAKSIKVVSTTVNFSDPKGIKRSYARLQKKAMAMSTYITSNRTEWMQHRTQYNQIVNSVYSRFKKTVSSTNADTRKSNNKIQKKEDEIATLKRKLIESKCLLKSAKEESASSCKYIKLTLEKQIRELKHDKNDMSSQIRRLEVKNRDKGGSSNKKDTSILDYKEKLDLKAAAAEQHYHMKVRIAEEKKEREQATRRRRQEELRSQIAVSGGRFEPFSRNSNSHPFSSGGGNGGNERNDDRNYMV